MTPTRVIANSTVLKGLHSLLEIHSVEEENVEPGKIDVIKTAHVDRPFIRCCARTMKRVDTTVLAEVMLCHSGVKVVDAQSIFTREDLKVFGVDPTVKGTFAAAVGAVAFRDTR